MGFYCRIEIKNGETIVPRKRDNGFVKDSVLEFLLHYSYYVEEILKNENCFAWYQKLETLTSHDMRVIPRALYAGDWGYSIHDYKLFLADYDNAGNISEEQFIDMIVELENKWTPIKKLSHALEELLQVLPAMGEVSSYWYHSDSTPKGLQGIQDTFHGVITQYGDECLVRINFI